MARVLDRTRLESNEVLVMSGLMTFASGLSNAARDLPERTALINTFTKAVSDYNRGERIG